MAYSALVLLKQTLDKILNPCPQISSLKEKVCYLLDFLEESSEKCTSAITDLEGQIRDAAYEAEDIIESHLAKEALAQSSTSFWEMFCSTIQNALPAFRRREVLNHDLELEIEHLQKSVEEFEFILDSFFKINKGKMIELLRPVTESLAGARLSRTTSCGQRSMVGLNEDLLKIKDWLTGSSSSRDVISIVGMGGIGKTTLGRNLYEDSLIDYHFDTRAWVTVSQDYHWQGVVKDLWNSIVLVKRESHDEVRIEKLAESVYKYLKGRRYLIVMDDVWHTKLWDDVRRLFPDDDNGSRIILTTRLSEVALSSESFGYIHDMNLLGYEESWNLLCAKVFGEECCPPELEKVGKDIARNCKGLPLALVTIGGVLSKRRTPDYWVYIARNVKSGVTGNDDRLLEILSLSYNHLPHHLKACFLYMGVFPEDREISVSRLIKLWVAEGFLKPRFSKSLEEVAEDYLEDLVHRSLIMVGKRGHQGEIKTCVMHDILRDLCVKKAKDERFLLVLNRDALNFPEVGYNEYRVSIHSHVMRVGMHDSRVRSFLYFAKNSRNLSLSFARFRLLKVLDALTITFDEFPTQMVELVSLRYLGLWIRISYSGLELPAAIVKLKNLQTLILSRGMYDFEDDGTILRLPSEIWEMPQLRHLSFKRGVLPRPSRERLDRENSFDMAHLQTLSGAENFKCRKEVFRIMPHLKKLGVSYVFCKRKKWSSSDFNSFVYLHSLETLILSFDDSELWKNIPMNFAFPPKLKKLTLCGCRISWSKMTMVGSLLELEVLKLKDSAFEGRVWEPEEGEFLQLKYLLLDGIHLRHWKANETHFPSLQQLSFFFCLKLEEIPSAIGDVKTLEMIELHDCSYSAVKSAKLIEEEQRNLGNESLKVRVK